MPDETAPRLSAYCLPAAVGFGDMVPMTFVGRFAVLVMICVGVVLIPVQASQVYTQLQARRVTLGETDCGLQSCLLHGKCLPEEMVFDESCGGIRPACLTAICSVTAWVSIETYMQTYVHAAVL